MKKVLTGLGAVAIVGSVAVSMSSCSKGKENPAMNRYDWANKLMQAKGHDLTANMTVNTFFMFVFLLC